MKGEMRIPISPFCERPARGARRGAPGAQPRHTTGPQKTEV